MRFVEPGNPRGSLKWIRLAVKEFPDLLNQRLREAFRLAPDAPITWACPLAIDDFAEYRDNDFVRLRGVELAQRVTEIIRLLAQDGWEVVATRGSHRQFKHPSKPGRVTVPGKPSDERAPGTLNSIRRQAGFKK